MRPSEGRKAQKHPQRVVSSEVEHCLHTPALIGELDSPFPVYQREAKPQKEAGHPQKHPQHYYKADPDEIARKLT